MRYWQKYHSLKFEKRNLPARKAFITGPKFSQKRLKISTAERRQLLWPSMRCTCRQFTYTDTHASFCHLSEKLSWLSLKSKIKSFSWAVWRKALHKT